ncbi:MAG TPA: hypothetical protein VM677_12450 [Actinokineospora sp.]|nr:hypothetical protein [Actinokineospora sp.]
MTIDERLEQAGERWRADQPPAPDVDFTAFGRRRRGWLLAAATAAAAVTVVAGVAVLTRQTPDGSLAGPPAMTTGPTATTSGSAAAPADPSSTIVRDGATVRASGQVVAAPGKPVEFCPDLPVRASLPAPPPGCGGFGIVVTGVDLTRLGNRRVVDGIVAGGATLVGTYQARELRVIEQSAQSIMTEPGGPARTVPCPAPAGGWLPGVVGDSKPLFDYVQQHTDAIAPVWMGYPDGHPTGPTNSPDYAKPGVLVVEVIPDEVDRFRGELAGRYSRNLCVTRAPTSVVSIAVIEANSRTFSDTIRPISADKRNGVYSWATQNSGRTMVELVMVDQRIFDLFTAVGFDLVELDPWLRPVP